MHRQSYRSHYSYPSLPSGIEVPVELHYGNQSVRLAAKIDTGASFCMFLREYAEALGVDVESGLRQTVATLNGQFVVFGHNLGLSCLEHRTDANVYFYQDYGLGRNVLGRTGWLDRHRLGIVDHDLSIYVSPYDDPGP